MGASTTWKLVPVCDHAHSKGIFPDVQSEHPTAQLCAIPIHPKVQTVGIYRSSIEQRFPKQSSELRLFISLSCYIRIHRVIILSVDSQYSDHIQIFRELSPYAVHNMLCE